MFLQSLMSKKSNKKSVASQRGLTVKQRALVDTLVADGGSIKEAAEKAGYSGGEAGRVTASRTLRLPHVQVYMLQAVSEAIGISSSTAVSRLIQLSRSARSEYVQLEASKDLLDRSGFKPPDRVQVDQTKEITVKIDLS